MNELRFIYVTVNNKKHALDLAHGLVKRKLVACANILEGMNSVYLWKNKVEENREVVMLLKTIPNHIEAVENYIQHHHSYETPCILSFNIEKGNEDFVKWVENSCKIAY